MHMSKRTRIQLAVFLSISLIALAFMAFGYMRLPSLLFGVDRYQVTVELPEAGGLYERANVTYRGTEVGEVKSVELTDAGAQAVLSLRSEVKIPSDLKVEVHSQSAVGEQFIALLPRNDTSPPLKNGDVIQRSQTSVPPDINALLDATNRGLQAIPRDSLKTTIDEGYTAVGGLGPEIARFLKGGAALSTEAKQNLDALTNVVDNVGPVLDTQTDTADSVRAWAAHLATVTKSLKTNDGALQGILQNGPAAAGQVQQLFDRLQPTLPVALANLAGIGDVAVTYRADLEQILVLLPQGAQIVQGTGVANRDTKQAYKGAFLSFNLNLNLPPACTTGFLPIQQQRAASLVDAPDRPAGTVYCRVPQDSPVAVRGARNYPCETRPGKRAATVKLCESDEPYVPLNDGFNWKGDPNATSTGQGVPQFNPGDKIPPGYPGGPPAETTAGTPPAAAPPPVAIAEYDPATGTYVGPDGRIHTQADLATTATKDKSWQQMLIPPN